MTENQMLKAIYDDMRLMKDDIQSLKDEVQATNEFVQEMNGDLRFLKGEVRNLQLTLENETNRNIRIIAEGHLDLNRKLDEALKTESEKELMQLRVNVLENDMRMVKEKIGIA